MKLLTGFGFLGLALSVSMLAACSGSTSDGGGTGGSSSGGAGAGGGAGGAGAGGTAGSGATSGGGGTGGVVMVDRSCAAPADCILGERPRTCCGGCAQAMARSFVEEQPCYIPQGAKVLTPDSCQEPNCDQVDCPAIACAEPVAVDCVGGQCVALNEGDGCDPNNHPDETSGCACRDDAECTCRIFTGADFEPGQAKSRCDPDTNRCVGCFYD